MNDQAKALRDIVLKNKQASSSQSPMKIITITSGKGGVGKSNFTANLAMCLKEKGKKPLILDADFGLANIEIIFGERPKYNLSHLIKEECTLQQLVFNSKYNIPFISGGSGVREMLFLEEKQLEQISEELQKVENMADTLLIDTGAGINDIVVKFCMMADEVFVIITPEPASMTDAYALIKTLVTEFNIEPKFKIIINKATDKGEAHQVFSKIAYACKHFLSLEIEYIGFVPYDDKLFEAVKKQQPIFNYDRKCRASTAYYQISNQITYGAEENINTYGTRNHWINKFKNIFGKK